MRTRVVVSVVLLSSILIISSADTSVLGEVTAQDYQKDEIPLNYDRTTTFSPLDYSFDNNAFEYSENAVNHTKSEERVLWIGSLGLPIGEIYGGDTPPARENFTGSFAVDILKSSYQNLSMYLVLQHTIKSDHESFSFYTKLFDGPVNSTGIMSGQIEDTLYITHYTLDNGSNIAGISYNYLLLEPELAYYSSLRLQFYLPSDQTWDKELEVAVKLNTTHNPQFFDLMLDRIYPATPPKKSSDNRWLYIGVPVFVLVILYVMRKWRGRV